MGSGADRQSLIPPARRWIEAGRQRGDADFPTFASALLKKGMAAGYGSEDAALIKVLRDRT